MSARTVEIIANTWQNQGKIGSSPMTFVLRPGWTYNATLTPNTNLRKSGQLKVTEPTAHKFVTLHTRIYVQGAHNKHRNNR